MKGIQTEWQKTGDNVITPPFPDRCCICENERSEVLEASVSLQEPSLRLEIPYCQKHIADARIYAEKVVNSPTLDRLGLTNFLIVWAALAAMFYYIFVSVAEFDKELGIDFDPPILQAVLVITLALVGIFGSPLVLSLTRLTPLWYMRRIAAKNNFSIPAGQKVRGPALGIVGASIGYGAVEGKLRVTISFADDKFANAFKAVQAEENRAREIYVI